MLADVALTWSQLKLFFNFLYVNVRVFFTTNTSHIWQSNKWQSNMTHDSSTHRMYYQSYMKWWRRKLEMIDFRDDYIEVAIAESFIQADSKS